MILIGRYDSPYVRRVGVSLHALAISFELLPLSPFSQARSFVNLARSAACLHSSSRTARSSSRVQRSSITKIGARRQPGELAHNELKVALNRGEIRAGLINSRLPSSR
jgi:hypothetical protein